MKEMTPEDKQRIDEMLQTYFPDEYYQEQREATIPLVAELLKEEKNKAIDECIAEMKRFCIALYSNGFMATPEEISRSLESLKSD